MYKIYIWHLSSVYSPKSGAPKVQNSKKYLPMFCDPAIKNPTYIYLWQKVVLKNTKTPKIAATVLWSCQQKSNICNMCISFSPKVVSEIPKLQKVNRNTEHLSNLDARSKCKVETQKQVNAITNKWKLNFWILLPLTK